MAKWEIIEDNKFKKQTGGKAAATKTVTTKNSKNNPKMLPEVTVVAPKTVIKNKPVIQKPDLAPYYIPEQDASKVNTFVNNKQVANNQHNPTHLLNLSNANFYNIPSQTETDSLYYESPYKNGEILNQEIWNKNKAIEIKKGKALEKNVKRGINIGQTIANGLEIFPPTAPFGSALNVGLTVPSLALNYHDKNYAGMIPDAVGLVPGNILPSAVDLGKSVGEIGYNGYSIYQDFKQAGGNTSAVRAATTNRFNIPVIKTPFSNLTPTSTYKEPSTVLIKDNRKINPVTNSPIKPTRDLKSGNYSASVVDAIISQAINNDVDPYKALAVGLQESKLDSEVGHAKDYTEDSFGTDPEKLNQMTQEQKLAFTMVNAIKDKEKYAKKLGYNDDEHYLQAYNGFGKLTQNTEKKYHNALGVGTNSFYGIDVTKNPIDTAKNPVYGKTVLSLANMLKTNPTITERIGAYNTFNNLLDKSPIGLIKKPFKNGGIIEDPMGQWAHPGSITRIPSNQITMEGVDYPLLGISDTGHTQMMYPGKDYSFRGKSVTEYPMMQDGGEVNFTYAGENHRVYEKESPTGNGKGIKGHIMVNHPTENKGKWDTIDLTKITNGKVKTVAQGVASTKKWHKENPEYANGGKISSWEIIEDTPQFQSGGKTNAPIYVSDPKDPRLQMYSDSLNVYNKGEKDYKEYLNINQKLHIPSTSTRIELNPLIYDGDKPARMQPTESHRYWYEHSPDYIAGTLIPSNSVRAWTDRYKPPTQPYILQLQDHAQKQINMPIMGNINSNQQISQPINNIPTVIPPPKDYVTIKTGSSYRNPETGAFEQKTFKIDKVTGKRISEDNFKNGGKTKKSNWQIIEY